MSESSAKQLLRRFNIFPKKSLGQHFMYDPVWLERVASAAEIARDDLVLEIGAGTGYLTRVLAQSARHVVAVEIDQRMLPVLESVLVGSDNVTVSVGDILELDPRALVGPHLRAAAASYVVVANIPYYITGAILRHLLVAEARPARMVLTVQSEVADRIVAAPGRMNLLAVSVQYYGSPRIVARVPAGAFYPRPDVDSAIVRIDLHPDAPPAASVEKWFFRVVRAGFGQKRKQLQNALTAGLHIERDRIAEALRAAGVDPRRRAETLAMEEWNWVAERLPAPPHPDSS